jgi:YD repeat-containing protein
MNNFFLVAVAFTLGYFCGATEAKAQTTYLYGAQGQSLGTIQKSGNTQYFYGPQGQSMGTAQQLGNTTYVYGASGQSVGTVMAPVAPLVMPTYAPTQSLTPMYDSIFGR